MGSFRAYPAYVSGLPRMKLLTPSRAHGLGDCLDSPPYERDNNAGPAGHAGKREQADQTPDDTITDVH